MFTKRVSRIAALCCGISALTAPGITFAQDESPQEGAREGVSDIIVTATRRSEKLQDVAMSVNVATGEQLQKLSIFDAKDVQQLAPGLEMTNTTGRNNTTTLRGVTFDPDQGTAPAVQVYYNEIPTDAQTAYTAIYDIQQIEVLRGPQGLLRGLSAPAGSITIATRRPSFDTIEGYAQATATTRAGYNFQAAVSLPFSDKVALRVAGLVDGNRINQVHNVNLGDQRSRSRTESVRATLGLKPSDSFTAYLTYQYLFADNRMFRQVVGDGNTPAYLAATFFGYPVPLTPDTSLVSGPPLAASDYGSVEEMPFTQSNETHLVNLAFDWDLGPATLSFVGAHQFTKLHTQRDNDIGNAVPTWINASNVVVPYKVNAGELRLASNNTDGLGWGVGAFYSKQTGTTVVEQKADTFFFPVSPAVGAYLPIDTTVIVPVNSRYLSFNANLSYKAGPLKIEGGIRYTDVKVIQTTDIYLDSPGNALFGIPAFSQGPIVGVPADLQVGRYKPITGGADISYAITPDLNVYVAYGHSYRPGSSGVAVPVGITPDLIRTKPEKTDSFEVGAKGSLADHRISFTLSAFYQKLDNYLSRFNGIYYSAPLNQPTAGFFDFNYNGDAKIKGVELTIDGRVTNNWDLNVNASYARARYSDALLPCNDFAGTGVPNQDGVPTVTGTGNVSFCQSNGRLAEVPDFSLNANTEIRFPMDNWTPFMRALLTYRPGFYSDRVDYDYKDRELLNLYLGVRSSDTRWEVSVFAKNVLNQKRITNISLGNATQPTSAGIAFDSGYRTVNVMNPREFGLTTNFRW